MNAPNNRMRIGSKWLKYYAKLRYHRCVITEGIRVIAFRNMDHLDRAMKQLGIKKLSDEEDVLNVQNKMLEDQGLEQSDRNRWLLGCATQFPWEIYACLLYEELANYKTISQKHTSLVYPPLETYLESYHAVMESLKGVRNTLLHPLKRDNDKVTFLQFMDRIPDYLSALVTAQDQIDAYLEWLRDSLIEAMLDEISDEQILEHSSYRIKALTSLSAQAKNEEDREAVEQALQQELAIRDLCAPIVNPNVALTASQQEHLVQWVKKKNILALPLPERPYPSSPDSVQVPIHRGLSSYLPDLPSEGEAPWTGQVLPEFLRQSRSECIALLLRALILFNEPYASMASGDSPRQSQPIEIMRNFHRFEMLTSPFIVSLALLSEPLRLYKQAASGRPELKREEIERYIVGEALTVFSRFRNIVFHVADDGINPDEVEQEFHRKASALGNHYHKIIGGLLRFYLKDPACSA